LNGQKYRNKSEREVREGLVIRIEEVLRETKNRARIEK